jgi:Tol biopolymer transport system component
MKRFLTAGLMPVLALSGAGILAGLVPAGVAHADGDTTATSRISVASDGSQGNGDSKASALSADGRYVAFDSSAANLVPGDTNNASDVFVRDRQTGATTRVSVASDGSQAVDEGTWPNLYSDHPSVSADGRYVLFSSHATNLVAGDTNGNVDAFVHDRETGATTRVSVASDGAEAEYGAFYAGISANGRYVTFISGSADLVAGDTNGRRDAFLHDRETGRTTRVSVSSDGAQGNRDTDYSTPVASDDGRFVAYRSWATNLVPGDTNDATDVFLRDTGLATTTRVSVAADGRQADELSYEPSISADGRYIVFGSGANNLVPGDTQVAADVFRFDRVAGTLTRISRDITPVAGQWLPTGSTAAVISDDGRYTAYASTGGGIVADDTNGGLDVFVYDAESGTTERVSRTATGAQSGGWIPPFPGAGVTVAISGDGRYVSYDSGATDLVDGDTNAVRDVFVSRRG